MNYPQFQDKSKTMNYNSAFSQNEQRQYENYARWTGGFIEDLYSQDYENEGLLFFNPEVETFLNTHCKWFVDHIEYYQYTENFHTRLKEMKCKTKQSSLPSHLHPLPHTLEDSHNLHSLYIG